MRCVASSDKFKVKLLKNKYDAAGRSLLEYNTYDTTTTEGETIFAA
jgi:hypothetical protein